MRPVPPPDQPFAKWDIKPFSAKITLHALGLDESGSVEVSAVAGEEHLRFNLPKHARAVRKFFRAIGVKDHYRLEYGCYESKEGVEGFVLEATAVGLDHHEGVEPTLVLQDAKVRDT